MIVLINRRASELEKVNSISLSVASITEELQNNN